MLELSLNEFLIFAFVLVRMSGLVVFAPFFGGENFPRRARVGLAAFLAFCVFGRAAGTVLEPFQLTLSGLGFLAARELFVGLVLGFCSSLVFSGFQLAGELIGQQVGFTLANVLDPLMEEEVGILSFFKFTLGVLAFITLNLHLVVLDLLGRSYEVVGLGRAAFSAELLDKVSRMFGGLWDVSLATGGPVILVMTLVSVVMGFLVRTMPQLNILVVGLPLRTLVGLAAVAVGVVPFCLTVKLVCEGMVKDLDLLVGLLAPAAGA